MNRPVMATTPTDFTPMAKKAKAVMRAETLEALADRGGYYSGGFFTGSCSPMGVPGPFVPPAFDA